MNNNQIREFKDMAPAECIRLMFEKTDENGMRYIPAWAFNVDDVEQVDRNEYRIKMDWDKEDLDRIIDDYDALYADIEKIGPVLNSLDDKCLKQFIDGRHVDVERRIGSNVFSIGLVVRTMRLCKLFEFGAPKNITENEEEAADEQ